MTDESPDTRSAVLPSGAGKSETAPAGIDRRGFLKCLGVAGAALMVGPAPARAATTGGEEPYGVLVDTTRCVGCRACEAACAEANGLPTADLDDDHVYDTRRLTSEKQWTVVNRYATDRGEVFAKKQCMHCVHPACSSACLTRAMYKTPDGPVVWRENKCMGCRFCMVSCPFDVPKFEYASAVPRIQKCKLCAERVRAGKLPACVEVCPAGALTFGRRNALLVEAHRRIADQPDLYIPQIYGEQDVGGTSWMYLASVPFEQLGFRTDLGTTPYPDLTKEFLYGVPVALLTVPAFLLAVSTAVRGATEAKAHEVPHESDARSSASA